MNNDIASLSNMRDIAVPDAPPLWPLAPGVWLVLAFVMLLAMIIVLQYRTNRRRNAYRRAGIALLDQVVSNHDVAVTLKRVALAAFPREQVAPLYGQDWLDFLNHSCQRCQFTDVNIDSNSDDASEAFVSQARTWIKHHHATVSDPGKPERQ